MIKKYICKKIVADGYERWAHLEHDELKKTILVHYIDQDYIEFDQQELLKKPDIIEGELSIQLVIGYEETDNIGFEQPSARFSQISACAEVVEILDDYSVMGRIVGFPENMKIEFEEKTQVHVEQNIEISGSLEIDVID